MADGQEPEVPEEGEVLDKEPEESKALDGLAQTWEQDKKVRRLARSFGRLLQWPPATHPDGTPDPDSSRVGLVDMDAMKLNWQVLCHLLGHWCPNAPDRKTCAVDVIKKRVGPSHTVHVPKIFL